VVLLTLCFTRYDCSLDENTTCQWKYTKIKSIGTVTYNPNSFSRSSHSFPTPTPPTIPRVGVVLLGRDLILTATPFFQSEWFILNSSHWRSWQTHASLCSSCIKYSFIGCEQKKAYLYMVWNVSSGWKKNLTILIFTRDTHLESFFSVSHSEHELFF